MSACCKQFSCSYIWTNNARQDVSIFHSVSANAYVQYGYCTPILFFFFRMTHPFNLLFGLNIHSTSMFDSTSIQHSCSIKHRFNTHFGFNIIQPTPIVNKHSCNILFGFNTHSTLIFIQHPFNVHFSPFWINHPFNMCFGLHILSTSILIKHPFNIHMSSVKNL